MLSQWSVVGRAKSKVADKTNDSFDERPATRRVQQFDQHWQPVVQANCILGHFRLRVPRCKVTEGADCRLSDVLSITSL